MLASLFIIMLGIPALFIDGARKERNIRNDIEEYRIKNQSFYDKVAEYEIACPNGWNPYLYGLYKMEHQKNTTEK